MAVADRRLQHVSDRQGRVLAQVHRLSDGRSDERRIAQRRQRHEHHPVIELLDNGGGRVECQPRFACPAGAGQRHQPSVALRQARPQLCQLVLAPDQGPAKRWQGTLRGRGRRGSRRGGRIEPLGEQKGKVVGNELGQLLGAAEFLVADAILIPNLR
ncbi:MAG: hypothetical protein KatS3mg060_0753 [Dehalococcoidia bacterium]|nr:MAG: hypothetical protein KatS3mg060_0753 [Dehalococcoidia bacterium]